MTISEMYQEIVEQEVADIFLDEDGYIIDDYTIDDTMEIEYDVQSYSILTPLSIPYHHNIMTKEVMISLLNRCNDGNDMLAVLDTLAEDSADEYQNSPTLETIEF